MRNRFFFALTLLGTVFPLARGEAVILRGPSATVRTPSFSHRDTLYVPVAAVARAWGMHEVSRAGGELRFSSPEHTLAIAPGSREARLDGKALFMKAEADWVDGKLAVPIYLALIDLPELLAPGFPPVRGEDGKKIRVFLDPGHGGKDPGAVSEDGIREKDVVLDISRRVKGILEARGFEVVMSRDDDVFIPLSRRSLLANRLRAAVFVSVHANAAQNRLAKGPETFYYSASADLSSDYLARVENAYLSLKGGLFGPENVPLPAGREDKSRQLAGKVQARIAALGGGIDRGVKTARFHVIRHSAMPSILVETGFLSHREEVALLGAGPYQQQVAEAVAEGVADYFRYGYGRELLQEKPERLAQAEGEEP